MRKDLRTRPHCDIYPLRQSAHRENKNCGIFATFLRLGAHFRPHKAKTGRHETDLPALLGGQVVNTLGIASVFYAGGIIGMVSILFCLVVAVGRLKRYSVK